MNANGCANWIKKWRNWNNSMTALYNCLHSMGIQVIAKDIETEKAFQVQVSTNAWACA
jgi:EAL domain-containing protein (putative c-di-GMP-specific phosphodiesterase class I)